MLPLTEVSHDRVAPYAALAAKEGASLKAGGGTTWFAITTSSGIVVACAGVWVGKNLARLKGQWTRPEERGAGHGRRLVEHSLAWAETQPVETIEVIQVGTGLPEFWPSYGFTFQSERKYGQRVYRKSVTKG